MKNNYLLTLGMLLIGGMSFAQERVTMIETFTSSTCPPCNPGNVQLQSILEDAGNEENHASLKYQMSWPGTGDPYFTTEGNGRRTYYGVSGVPSTHIDGGSGFNPTGFSQGQLDAAVAVTPKCEILAYYEIDEAGQTVDIWVRVIALEDFPGGTTLHTAIHEFKTDNNVKTNGETEFEHVMKKMVPGTSGTFLTGVDAGDTVEVELSYTFEGDYVLPPNAGSPVDHGEEHSVEEFSDLGVICWVQRITTKEVFNAANASFTALGVDENESTSTIANAKIYPNPADNNAAIAYHSAVSQDVEITIVNTMGQVVYTNTINNAPAGRSVEDVNTEDFANGIYMVNITSNTGNITKKLSIQR